MYDIVFLGGGPAGYEGAIYSSKMGFKTAVVEKDKLGGTCLQRGCVPTKALLHMVKGIKIIKNISKYGIRIDNYEIDIEYIKKYKNRVVGKLTKGIEFLFKKNNIDLISGEGKVINKNTILINNEKEIKAKYIVVSTGSKPAELPFLKIDNQKVMDSTKALEIEVIPENMLVIGAGAVGLEIGLIYSYLGSKVDVVEIMDDILPGSDRELTSILKTELKKQKLNIMTSTKMTKVEEGEKLKVLFKNEKGEFENEYDLILLSAGRTPNTKGIFDESLTDIKIDKRGFIGVNKNLQTGIDNIFSCGDVVGAPLLAHKASHQAIAIVDFIKNNKEIDLKPIPAVVFTFPEFATIGFTEERAKEENIDYKVGKFPYSAGSRSNAIDQKQGLVKVIADKNNNIIGAHIVGEDSGELISVFSIAMANGVKLDNIKEVVFSHPTLSENLWEACGEASDFSIHI